MRQKLVAGNWKMHGGLAANRDLLSALTRADVAVDAAVCAPFPYLAQVQAALTGSRIAWGAQNVSQHAEGAYTGEVSVRMLRDFACRYVIVGHSERRALYGESSTLVAEKYAAAQAGGLVPILCLGETLEQREAGRTGAVVTEQLDAVIAASGVASLANAVVAYEPVWAIGTGRTATPEQAQETHALIRSRVAEEDQAVAQGVRILYGGSVKASNAAALFAMADIDGGLIGGASLVADEFISIMRAACAH